MQLNPARGRKLKIVLDIRYDWISPVYAAQPREGTETITQPTIYAQVETVKGLCSSTPRGDGNYYHQSFSILLK